MIFPVNPSFYPVNPVKNGGLDKGLSSRKMVGVAEWINYDQTYNRKWPLWPDGAAGQQSSEA